MNPDEIASAILRAAPIPSETFARTKWMGDAADICGDLARQYRREEAALIRRIQDDGLTSDTYALAELFRPYARVDLPRLKENEPAMYAKLVHVNTNAAVKAVGVRRFYEMMAEELGDISDMEVVTVTDVRKTLPAAVASLYVIDEDVFLKYAVVEKDV